MTPHIHIRRLTALFAATAVALMAVAGASAGTSSSYDPWAVGLVHQYRASGSGLDPWAVGLVKQSRAADTSLDPWAVGLVRNANSGTQFASVRTVQPAAVVTVASSGFHFGDAAVGAGAAFVAVLLVGGSIVAVRRRQQHTPQLSS